LLPAIVAALDGIWVFVIGVGSGFAYDAIAHTRGNPNTYVASGIAIAALFCAFARPAELYRPSNLLRISLQIRRAAATWIMAFGCIAAIAFVLKIGAMFSRGATLTFFFGGLLLLAVSRVLWAHAVGSVLASGVLARKRVAVVGMLDQLKSNELLPEVERYGYVITRAFALPDKPIVEPEESVAARMREVVAYAQSARLDEIMLAVPWSDVTLLDEVTAHLEVLPIPVKLMPDMAVSRLLAQPLYELGETKAVELQHAPLSLAQCITKQAIDRSLAAAFLFLLFPLFGIVALAIRLESPGPAFFLQARVGFNGRRFRIFKFRTMSTLDDGPVVQQAQRNDKRVTGLGRLLRKLSIDELPQLLNVLRGEMSLVGPRPHALAHDDAYDRLIASYAMRRKVKPGITGWAQVNGCRGETPDLDAMERRIDHDLWYIEYWSIWLDLRILLMTAVQVVWPKDVY
jgi:Undecaprenyl-phosphate glucose phosphotransferase